MCLCTGRNHFTNCIYACVPVRVFGADGIGAQKAKIFLGERTFQKDSFGIVSTTQGLYKIVNWCQRCAEQNTGSSQLHRFIQKSRWIEAQKFQRYFCSRECQQRSEVFIVKFPNFQEKADIKIQLQNCVVQCAFPMFFQPDVYKRQILTFLRWSKARLHGRCKWCGSVIKAMQEAVILPIIPEYI